MNFLLQLLLIRHFSCSLIILILSKRCLQSRLLGLLGSCLLKFLSWTLSLILRRWLNLRGWVFLVLFLPVDLLLELFETMLQVLLILTFTGHNKSLTDQKKDGEAEDSLEELCDMRVFCTHKCRTVIKKDLKHKMIKTQKQPKQFYNLQSQSKITIIILKNKVFTKLMHNYNPPNKYSHTTRMGNWSEEWELEEVKRKQYVRNKNNGTSLINDKQKKLLKSLQSASLTYSKDGLRRFGDHVMLFNGKVEGFLGTDAHEKLLNTEESYNVSAIKNIHACARSVFLLERVNLSDGFKDNVIHFGQQVRIRINPLLLDRPIYLYSEPVSINRYSKVSRLQEAIFMLKQNFNTVWIFEHPDPNIRLEMTGQPITVDDTVLIRHQMTNQWLAADTKTYDNIFGKQFEVLVHNFLVHNKSQNLIQQKRGVTTIDIPSRAQKDQNLWLIMGASDPSQQFDESQIKNNVVNKNTLDKKMKHLLTERGIYGIRFLHKIFKSLDKQNLGCLDQNDFRWGLQSGKLHLTEEEVTYVCNYFRASGNNISYSNFMKDLRGKLNQNRAKAIEDAYNRVRKVTGSKVTVQELGKVYDAARHPEVITSKKSQQQAFNEFIWSWDNIKPGYEVCLQQFASYYQDISAIIPRDQHFEYLLLSVFHL